jgi:replicative DNA helicase
MKDIDLTTGGKCVGDLWIIGGRPGSGKSAMMCNSIIADGRAGVPVLFFEKEMNYQSLIERLVAIDSAVPIQNIRLGLLDKKQVEEIGLSMKRIREFPIYLDTTFSSDIHYMESTIYKYKSSKKIEVVYLDYLQLMSERGDNQTAELGQISRMCKLIANDQNVCVIAASQLNRRVEERDNKRPIMSDLRQSGNLEEDADYVIGLYRDEYYNPDTKFKNMMEFTILKARNGPVGTITLRFNPESNKVENK